MGKGPGSEIADAIRHSLDGMPIHVRQLSEMFRKHGNAHKRNDSTINDMDRVPESLRDGWNTDSRWNPDQVQSWGKGDRPDPSEYLDDDYIRDHLAQFEDGASRIYFSDSLHKWGPGNNGTTYVFPTSELQQILDETGGDPFELADRLGMKPSDFFDADGNALPLEVRHFDPSELTNIRVPSGNEGGANPQWIPGGYLPTGIPEAVIDIPGSATGVGNVIDDAGNVLPGSDYNPGLWPGTSQSMPS